MENVILMILFLGFIFGGGLITFLILRVWDEICVLTGLMVVIAENLGINLKEELNKRWKKR